ncbi:MAG: putative menaquinol-cytochrome c reductase cytochrome b subunit [Clostridiales bacterium]|nr:putative menaquinol-cytochrome c reductase cytochrome b subunit [Clostridiales bacterium]
MTQRRNHGLIDFILHIHPPRINSKVTVFWPTMCMGGLSFFLFLLLLLTGILLMFFYGPGDPKTAFNSLTLIQDIVPYGSFIRSIHKWAGQLMVFTIVVHLARVVLTGSYRPPREFNWIIGVILLVLTVFLDFTGYLLIGDATARYATKVAFSLTGQVPLAGSLMQIILFGGNPTTDLAGLRIYLWHCVILPLVLTIFMGWHFYRVRKDGGVKWPL